MKHTHYVGGAELLVLYVVSFTSTEARSVGDEALAMTYYLSTLGDVFCRIRARFQNCS